MVAGIVDATDVYANTYVATNAGGEFLAYDTSAPSAGHLINAIAGSAGTDSATNTFPKGLYGQQLTLKSQGSAPATFTGSSQLYTSTSGRLRYVSESGADLVLDRSNLNLTNKTMGTQTTGVQMSQPLSYLAGEAQAGSEYEIEIDGTITTPTSGVALLYNSSLFLDGAGFGASNITWGTVMLPLSKTVGYHIRWTLTVNTTGAGGTCDVIASGGTNRMFDGGVQTNMGNINTASPISQITTGVAFDTTLNHTLQIYHNWSSGASSGHSAITYRTKITRRN